MVRFEELNLDDFLKNYWQKKPLLVRNALPNFVNALTPDELAGLAMEEDLESRIVFETPKKAPFWHLRRGPFLEKEFANLGKTNWTLLVQGLDRFIPEISAMREYFNFIPQWRFDDVMVSYAVKEGSVGPHYDNYDVFLYQALGSRKWLLTSKNCNEKNTLPNIELRLMQEFEVEEEYLLEEGDMLYLPPHIGHHGIAISQECMTYSFGYRSYQSVEIIDSFASYLSENKQKNILYMDPDWSSNSNSSAIPKTAVLEAKRLMQNLLDDENQLENWFGCFVTQLDEQAEDLLPLPLKKGSCNLFVEKFSKSFGLKRNPLCRFAYMNKRGDLSLFINGCIWNSSGVSSELIKLIGESILIDKEKLKPYLSSQKNLDFLFELWRLQWLEFQQK